MLHRKFLAAVLGGASLLTTLGCETKTNSADTTRFTEDSAIATQQQAIEAQQREIRMSQERMAVFNIIGNYGRPLYDVVDQLPEGTYCRYVQSPGHKNLTELCGSVNPQTTRVKIENRGEISEAQVVADYRAKNFEPMRLP